MSLMELARQGARTIGEQFTKQDADWRPTMFYRTPDDQVHILMLDLFNERDKDQIAARMQEIVWRSRAVEAVFISSAWTVESSKEELAQGPRIIPSRDVRRQECLILTHVDQEGTSAEVAKIERHISGPPALGEFEPVAEGLDVAGRFVDAIRAGFR